MCLACVEASLLTKCVMYKVYNCLKLYCSDVCRLGDGVPHALSVVKQIDEAACASRLCTDMGLSWPIVLFSEHDGHLTEALLTLLELHVCAGWVLSLQS